MANSKSKKLFIFVGLLIIAGLVGGYLYLSGAEVETSNNAQLDADIVPVRSSIPGYVKEVYFKDNQVVSRGELLLALDDTELQARVMQAEAALENARANLAAVRTNALASDQNATAAAWSSQTSQQNISVAQARLNKVRDDFRRIQGMYADKAATQAEYDGVKAELAVAEAQLAAAQNQYKASNVQSQGVRSQAEGQKSLIALAEATIRQREAELILAKTQLGYAVISAPCDGIVSKRSIEAGQYISPGQPVCSVVDNTHLWVTANFKETQVQRIHPGQPVDIKIDAYPDLLLHGSIDSYIGATGARFSLLPPDNATGNFVKIVQRVPVKIALNPLSDKQMAYLLPGLSAFVTVKID